MNLIYQNYESYRQEQIAENRRKASCVWATKEELSAIADHLLVAIGRSPRFGLCHGCRMGWEVAEFSELLDCPVVGTDIVPECEMAGGIVCHDMHEPHPDFIGKCDFVYSNSFDHCYDFPKFLESQSNHLTDDGWLYLTHSEDKLQAVNEADCLGISLDETIDICSGTFNVVGVIQLGDIYNPSFKATLKGVNVVCCTI